jgi:hypothetical protein
VSKPPAPDFSLDELLAALAGPEQSLDGYHTSAEWREKLSVTDKRLSALLHRAQQQGKLGVQRAQRGTLDGRSVPVPVYAFKLGER